MHFFIDFLRKLFFHDFVLVKVVQKKLSYDLISFMNILLKYET